MPRPSYPFLVVVWHGCMMWELSRACLLLVWGRWLAREIMFLKGVFGHFPASLASYIYLSAYFVIVHSIPLRGFRERKSATVAFFHSITSFVLTLVPLTPLIDGYLFSLNIVSPFVANFYFFLYMRVLLFFFPTLSWFM